MEKIGENGSETEFQSVVVVGRVVRSGGRGRRRCCYAFSKFMQ
jgi:hypothetical protein